MDTLRQKLSDLAKVQPETAWKTNRRELLMSQISAQYGREAHERSWTDRFAAFWHFIDLTPVLRYTLKPIGVAAVAGLALFTSWAIVGPTTRASVPGQVWYPVKLVSERAQSALAISDEDRVALAVRFAQRRSDELKQVSTSGSDEVVSKVANRLTSSLTVAQSSLKHLADRKEKTIAAAKSIDEQAAIYEAALEDARAHVDQKSNAGQAINGALNRVDETNVAALAVLIDQQDLNDEDKAVLIARLSAKLEKAAASLEHPAVKDDADATAARLAFAAAAEKLAAKDLKAALSDFGAGQKLLRIVEGRLVEIEQQAAKAPAEGQGTSEPTTDGEGSEISEAQPLLNGEQSEPSTAEPAQPSGETPAPSQP